MAKKKKGLSKKKWLLIAAVVLLFCVAAFMYQRAHRSTAPTTTTGQTVEQPKVDLSPPTTEDQKAVDSNKNRIVSEQEQQNQTPSSSQKTVTPVITGVSASEVRAYVQGVVEDGGTCSVTATRGSQTVTGSSSAIANVSTTQCGPISVSLGSGTWKVVVSYTSSTASGKSQEGSYEVK